MLIEEIPDKTLELMAAIYTLNDKYECVLKQSDNYHKTVVSRWFDTRNDVVTKSWELIYFLSKKYIIISDGDVKKFNDMVKKFIPKFKDFTTDELISFISKHDDADDDLLNIKWII